MKKIKSYWWITMIIIIIFMLVDMTNDIAWAIVFLGIILQICFYQYLRAKYSK